MYSIGQDVHRGNVESVRWFGLAAEHIRARGELEQDPPSTPCAARGHRSLDQCRVISEPGSRPFSVAGNLDIAYNISEYGHPYHEDND